MKLRLGKALATADERDLRFADYATALPAPPAQYGYAGLVRTAWGMLGNDEWGDCAWAGPAHETMLLNAEAGRQVAFTTAGVLSDYASTGFDPHAGPPGNNPTDQGSNVRDVMHYRATKGILDAAGRRHKIGAYVKIDHGNQQELRQAISVFTTIGVGVSFPESGQQQFLNHQPWRPVPGSPIEGGHYVCLVAYDVRTWTCVTWGALQQMTVPWLEDYIDEAWAYISQEDLTSGKTIDGFDLAQLKADLAALPKEA